MSCSRKRKNTGFATDGALSSSPLIKKARIGTRSDEDSDADASQTSYTQGRLDRVYGQRGAFPGLDALEGEDGEPFYGPPTNGMEYLKMVRLEAKAVPTIVRAPGPEDAERIYYKKEDEEECKVPDRESEKETSKPQEEYYSRLTKRFQILRNQIHSQPPISTVSNLAPSALISLPSRNRTARTAWKKMLAHAPPHTVQLACMDSQSALNAVPLLASLLVSRVVAMANANTTTTDFLAPWTWGLLARCREVTEMQSEDVNVLRELGKKAVGCIVLLRTGVEVPGLHDIKNECEDDNDPANVEEQIVSEEIDVNEDLEAAKERLRSRLAATNNSANTDKEEGEVEEAETTYKDDDSQTRLHVLLDMIVTIVGELYGQRDLLEYRDVW